MYWKRLSGGEIKQTVEEALSRNVRFGKSKVMGLPISSMDPRVFSEPNVQEPFLRALLENANHGGCPTQGIVGNFFEGTEELEIEAVRICAEQIMGGKPGMQDGYVAAGGTECNIHALWVYRNLFKRKYGARLQEIALLHSEDTHYSLWKAANLLGVEQLVLEVDPQTRQISHNKMVVQLHRARKAGIKYFIFIANMGTTMFGSVDDIDRITTLLDEEEVFYKVHVDAAFGGFTYPFTHPAHNMNFANKRITSISLDAHKMLQAPYGTGIFLIRKGYLDYLSVQEPKFMAQKVHTLSGSRAGANAIAVWMLLKAYGSKGLNAKVKRIMDRKAGLCRELDKKNIRYFHEPHMNIVTIHDQFITKNIEEEYGLVPDNHEKPTWWKVVLMDHVDEGLIREFLEY